MRITSALLCDAANLSGDGALNVLGAFTLLYAQEFPYVHPSMSLAIQFEFSPDDAIGEYLLTALLIDPDGAIARESHVPVVVSEPAEPGRSFRMHVTEFLDNVHHGTPGDYELRILYQTESLAVVPYRLIRY
ncbi:MAG: hypothetical protein OXI41_00245 [Chloroflexota bacterium]|nr:hypothetical protein [Chloroflexota bacterium]MDE2893910.1 hypothetical protein [Chloroflexota bacterium]